MAHVVTLQYDTRDTTVVYLSTDPDMAHTMGGFGPARFVGRNPPIRGVSYVMALDDLPRFRVYATNRGIRVVDTPTRPGPRPPWMERPLPECTHCGQPVRRGAQPTHCPNCGAPWDPTEVANG
jgi:hypothetical protein